jgi:hypothetical protein
MNALIPYSKNAGFETKKYNYLKIQVLFLKTYLINCVKTPAPNSHLLIKMESRCMASIRCNKYIFNYT